MRTLILIAFLYLTPALARADLTIFDVRKNLPMSDDDKVYRDFYINGGSEQGLMNGMVITVQRRLPLYDSYQNRSAGDLDLKVARVKIIHVQRGLAVARLHSEFTRDNAPLLEDNFIMVGDRLDLSSATRDSGKKAETGAGEQPPSAQAQPVPQEATVANIAPTILINSVELSSEAPKPPTPNAVEAPTLQ